MKPACLTFCTALVLLGASPALAFADGVHGVVDDDGTHEAAQAGRTGGFEVKQRRPLRRAYRGRGGPLELSGSLRASRGMGPIFSDGFESADSCAWSASIPELPCQPALPPGAVALYSAASCPTGWSPLVAARGRTLVAQSQSIGQPLGGGLNDLQVRLHSHPVTVATDTEFGGAHDHYWSSFVSGNIWYSRNSAGQTTQIVDWGAGIGGPGASTPLVAQQGAHYTSAHAGHQHEVSGEGNSSVGWAGFPYLQLLVCRKD